MGGKATILIIEDERDIREIVSYNLTREGYSVKEADTAEKGLEIIKKDRIDLTLLDMMLPGLDGMEALRRIRADKQSATLPVIMVTARSEDADVVACLELGADDYVSKPFSPRVLVARVRARLRETGKETERDGSREERVSSGGVDLDEARHEVRLNGQDLSLSATEFALLSFLMRNPSHVFSRQRLIDALHGPGYPVTDRSIDVQVLGLRKKLGEAGNCVETVRGVGYRWKEGE